MKSHSKQMANPSMEHKYESESDDDSALSRQQSMLALNKCRYTTPVQSSIFSDRMQVLYSFNPSSYSNIGPSTIAQIILNSGSAYLNGSGCSVTYTLSFARTNPSANQNIARNMK